MVCPKCRKKPFKFTTFLVTGNPFRITCSNCSAALRAGPSAYVWTALHVPLGFALLTLYRTTTTNGLIDSGWARALMVLAILGTVFITAFVIPWVAFNGTYRERTSAG